MTAAYKCRIYVIIERDTDNRQQYMEFESDSIAAGVIRHFEHVDDIDLFSIRTLFDHISTTKIMSADLSYNGVGCDLHTTGWLAQYKESKNRTVMIVEIGTNNDSKDTLFAWKWFGAGVKDVILTPDGAIAVFDFTDKGEESKSNAT
jgi:hypothetical protein